MTEIALNPACMAIVAARLPVERYSRARATPSAKIGTSAKTLAWIAAIPGLAGLHVGPTDLGLALRVGRSRGGTSVRPRRIPIGVDRRLFDESARP